MLIAYSLNVQILRNLFKNGKEASIGYVFFTWTLRRILLVVSVAQPLPEIQVCEWQKQKVLFSVPVSQVIVEEMFKKTSHPQTPGR